MDGTEKMSSDELFTVLDEGSEKTAFSTDVCRCPEKVIFGLGMFGELLLLRGEKSGRFKFHISKDVLHISDIEHNTGFLLA